MNECLPLEWISVLTLNAKGEIQNGSEELLTKAIRNGADLRIRTDFRFNEHLDPASTDDQWVEEVSDFRTTYLIDDSWAAGIMTLRYPVAAPHQFGPRPSLSYFLYNQNGDQAIARPYLDGQGAGGKPGPSEAAAPDGMLKYHAYDAWDGDTNAPSSNFRYDFEGFDFLVKDNWTEVYSHDAEGRTADGSLDALTHAVRKGCEIKVGVHNLCQDLSGSRQVDHEVFVPCGSGYFCTKDRLFFALSQPTVRVRAGIPVRYTSHGWDFGWLLIHTDGVVQGRICDPYTLAFQERTWRCALRWFVR